VKREWYPLVQAKTVDACIVIVGNKADLKGRIAREEPEQWCTEKNVEYIETSVK
jgi:GTPase SAR1 family protein